MALVEIVRKSTSNVDPTVRGKIRRMKTPSVSKVRHCGVWNAISYNKRSQQLEVKDHLVLSIDSR